MASSYGIGLRTVLPWKYEADPNSPYTYDELLFHLIEQVALDEEHEVRDLYDKETLMVSQQDSDPEAGVFMAQPGVGGPLDAESAGPILAAVQRVGRSGSLPQDFFDFAPDLDASLLIPGLPVTSARPVWQHLRIGTLPFEPPHPLAGLKCGGLEEHLAALVEWRDGLLTEPTWKDKPGRDRALACYAQLLPVLEVCRDHQLVFTLS
ncbi:MAG TPA: hypothetical protein VHU81_01680 [Thermoanaerobaculia bacterium]|jgi:hypothetical protein|nr:hypothetical protein [Thermoanaerobaculia bacterium]